MNHQSKKGRTIKIIQEPLENQFPIRDSAVFVFLSLNDFCPLEPEGFVLGLDVKK